MIRFSIWRLISSCPPTWAKVTLRSSGRSRRRTSSSLVSSRAITRSGTTVAVGLPAGVDTRAVIRALRSRSSSAAFLAIASL